jgi:hypothetical protein
MLLGSFIAGTRGSLRGRRAADLEHGALRGGYIGGLAGVALVVADITIRYAIL